MLLKEEDDLTKEIIKNAEKSRVSYQENLKSRVEEAERQEENARLSFVKSKRDQQFLDMCPEARDHFLKRTTKNIKYCNLMQIAENNEHKNEEKKLDSMWHNLMLNNVRNFL